MLQLQVLVLNQNYEPLSVCTARRAIVLVFLGKAEIVEHRDQMIHATFQSFILPSIVRLMAYVRIPNTGIILSRKNVIKRDGHQCQYCGTTRGPMTVDHIIPKYRLGEDTWENLVCACQACNNKKGDRTLTQASMELLRKPRQPTRIHFIRDFIGVGDHAWRPYLFLR